MGNNLGLAWCFVSKRKCPHCTAEGKKKPWTSRATVASIFLLNCTQSHFDFSMSASPRRISIRSQSNQRGVCSPNCIQQWIWYDLAQWDIVTMSAKLGPYWTWKRQSGLWNQTWTKYSDPKVQYCLFWQLSEEPHGWKSTVFTWPLSLGEFSFHTVFFCILVWNHHQQLVQLWPAYPTVYLLCNIFMLIKAVAQGTTSCDWLQQKNPHQMLHFLYTESDTLNWSEYI